MKPRLGLRCAILTLVTGLFALAPLGCATTAKGLGNAAGKLAVGATAAVVAAGVNHAANGEPAKPGDNADEDLERERREQAQRERHQARQEADVKLRKAQQSEQTTADDYPSL
jgi:hypothetical protein